MTVREIGRLAMREEGKVWNAYYALPGSMEGSILLGSIALALVSGDGRGRERKAAFMSLMRECVGDILEIKLGERPMWKDPQPAPEGERSGSA